MDAVSAAGDAVPRFHLGCWNHAAKQVDAELSCKCSPYTQFCSQSPVGFLKKALHMECLVHLVKGNRANKIENGYRTFVMNIG